MQKIMAPLPAHLIPEIEAWGQATADLFGKIREQAGLAPNNVPSDQIWFWTKRWQEGEQLADQQLSNGDYQDFATVDDLLADLAKAA